MAKQDDGELTLLLRCRDLPGTTFDGRTAVRLGIQKGPREVVNDVLAAGEEVTFRVPLRLRPGGDVGGPFVQGGPGGRFVYLCWGERGEDGAWDGLRRAKLPLTGVTLAPSGIVEARLRLTDAKGGPECGTLRGAAVEWTPVG